MPRDPSEAPSHPRASDKHTNERRSFGVRMVARQRTTGQLTELPVSVDFYSIDAVKTSSKVKAVEQKKLNCEICGCSYISLRKHLNSETHQQFMRNPENYSALSSLISKLPYNMPDCLTGPLTEIKFQNKEHGSPVRSVDCGGSNAMSRVMLSVKKECTGVVVQSTFRGNLSAVKHIKVVRSAAPSSTPQPSPPKVTATLCRTLKKRLLCQSEVGTDATGCRGGPGQKLRRSDSIHGGADENLVPPSHTSDADSVEKSLLGSMCNHLPREQAILPEVAQIVDELASPALLPGATSQHNGFQEDTSTREYSWTDASGLAADSGVSKILEACESSESDNDSFLRFLETGVEGRSLDSQLLDLSDSGKGGVAAFVPQGDRTSSCY